MNTAKPIKNHKSNAVNYLTLLSVFVAFFVMQSRDGDAQIYKFQQFKTEMGLGLNNQFIYSIAQDKYGFVWFATGLGPCRYNGFRFSSPEGNLSSINVTAIFKDDKGNLWFGYGHGLTVKYDGFEFSIADSISKTAITQIIQAPGGEILAATQSMGITRIGKKIDQITEGIEGVMINAICFASNDRLLLGSNDGLYLYHYASDQQNLTFIAKDDLLDYLTVKTITPKADGSGYWVATEYDGVFSVAIEGEHFSSLPLDIPELWDAQAQSIYEDEKGNLWISTFGAGLLRVHLAKDLSVLKTTAYNSRNGMGSDHVKAVFFDNQQNLWVATYGNGVACITNAAFSFFDALEPIGKNATAVFSENNTEYWIAGLGTIIRKTTKPEPSTTILGRANGLPNDKITLLRADHKGDMWIGTEKSGLYKLPKDTKNVSRFFHDENSLSNAIQGIIFDDKELWIATHNGVLIVDAQNGRLIEQYSTSGGELPHNKINDILEDSKRRIWVATNSNSLINIRNNRKLVLPDRIETEFSAITEDKFGRIWAGTLGKGVYLFDEAHDTTYHFTTNDGLMSDYCYAMTYDGSGRIWIGHRMGLSGINAQRLTINTFGKENGIYGDVNPLAMTLNKDGEFLIGMTDGVLMFDTESDQPQELTPMLNLMQVTINDQPYSVHQPLVLPYKRYKVQFDFVGLQYANPTSVSYQYFLQGYDTEWTPFTKSTTAIFSRVVQGEYHFWVKACNSDNCTKEMMLFTLKVRNPFYLTWWFLLLMIATIIGLGYIVISIRERTLRKQQEYLENELKARTKEVHRQKEEIEVKNRDITDSINYAQRIQLSVLPSTSTLMRHCSDAFILYQPRDIVSGDFYWFEFFPKNNRLLIVCADATGHGVPGAFMSLIGTTLIKDIAMRRDVKSPADILNCLDGNIQTTLNQNIESEQANDGMDIIVCEINTQTYFTRIASAMRPYIVFQNGKPSIHKYNRLSIGGQHLENKEFEMAELQLSKGDTIYMFTDGYADQFGGPSGKKLKLNRLMNIITDIYNRDMSEQHRVIKDNFDLWKGSDLQVDDVLMIGVRL